MLTTVFARRYSYALSEALQALALWRAISPSATVWVVHMRREYSVFLFLAVFGTAPDLSAQVSGQRPAERPESGFTLGQNYPNPFNPETKIPFELSEGLFVDGRTAVVSVRIYNVLQQFVATPTALSHPNGQTPLVDLEYITPGRYEAYWDGLDQAGRKVASGIYFVQLTVNGERAVIRMYVTK